VILDGCGACQRVSKELAERAEKTLGRLRVRGGGGGG